MTHRVLLGTTACLSTLLVGTSLAQDPTRVQDTTPPRANQANEKTRFVDAVTLRGALVYTSSATTQRKDEGQKRDTQEKEDAQVYGTTKRPQAGDIIGSVTDLVAAPGRTAAGAGGTDMHGNGCMVKALVQLSSTAGRDGGTDGNTGAGAGAHIGTANTVAIPLNELTWNAEGRFFTCNKSGEALRSMSPSRSGANADPQQGDKGDKSTQPKPGNVASPGLASEGWKFSELAMAPLKTMDGTTGRVATLVVDTRSGTLSYLLASGIESKTTSEAAGKREGAAGEASGKRTDKDQTGLVTPTGHDNIVVPFGIARVEGGTAGHDTKRGEDRTADRGRTGEDLGTKPLGTVMGGLTVTIPMTTTAIAGAPQLSATQLERLEDPTFKQRIDSFYASANPAGHKGQ